MGDRANLDRWIAAVVSAAIVYAARPVLTPLLCSFLAAFMIEPVVRRLADRVGRTAAVAATLSALLILLCVLLIFLVPYVVGESVQAAESIQQNISALNATLHRYLDLLPPEITERVAESISDFSGKIIAWAANMIGAGFGLVSGVAAAVSRGLLFLIGFVFLMLDFPMLKPGLINLLARCGCGPNRIGQIDGFLEESDTILRSFFRGQILYAAAIGALTAIGLFAVRLPYAVTIGISVGILSLVPYAGVAAGLLVALGVSIYTHETLIHLVLTSAVFGLVQFVDAVYLTPKLLGGAVGLHPLLAVVALLAFSHLFGFFGLLLAIPLAAMTLAALHRLLVAPGSGAR